jgi:hypothetical protein
MRKKPAVLTVIIPNHAHNLNLLSQSVIESLPLFSAALAIPDLAALIFSAYWPQGKIGVKIGLSRLQRYRA